MREQEREGGEKETEGNLMASVIKLLNCRKGVWIQDQQDLEALPQLGLWPSFSLQISFILSSHFLHMEEERRTGNSRLPFLLFESQKGEKGMGGEQWQQCLFHQLEDPVRIILGKNSDWPGLVSMAVSEPIRDLFPEERRDECQVSPNHSYQQVALCGFK